MPGRFAFSTVTIAASWLMGAGHAYAAPVCPEQTLRTPYMTAVTTTLACTDPVHPIIRYLPFQYPYATFTIAGDQATITPGPSISNTEVVFNYRAENAAYESTIGALNVQVGPAPPPPPQQSTNRPPLARCDSYSVKPGDVVNLARPGVLANDSDPDGGRLRVEGAYDSGDNFPWPFINFNGALRFEAPSKPRMLSYRYFATDGLLWSESTVTFWIGMKDRGCRPAFDPPPFSEVKLRWTLLESGGAVRIRAGGRWRRLGARYKPKRALMVDARRGSVTVRLLRASNYEREVESARFAGGLFKLGENTKLPNGKVLSSFNTVELAGRLSCPGPGRRLEVAARPGAFLIGAQRLRAQAVAIRNRRVLARFSVADRCNGTSVVQSTRGRVYINDHNTRKNKLLTGRGTYVAHPRG